MDVNGDGWFERMFNTSPNELPTASDVTSNMKVQRSFGGIITDTGHIEKNGEETSNQKNDIISRMFSHHESNNECERKPTIDESECANQEQKANQTQRIGKQIVFKTHDMETPPDNVINRMFCSTENADYSEEALFEIVREISSIDISIKEHNLHLRKLRQLKNKLEEDLLKYLEYFQKEGIRINGTNEIFCSAIRNKKKINKNIHASQEIQDFAKSHGIVMNQEKWQQFEKLWKKNSLTKIKTPGLKRIKQA